MRLWVLSDLHVEFGAWIQPSPPPDHDVVVVAGDVGERLAARVLPWLRATFPGPQPVLYVPGNHDFYRTTLQREIVAARAVAADLGLHLLAEGESVVFGDTRFIGATLWTDYALKPEARAHAMNAAQDRTTGMNDHRRIKAVVAGGINAFRPGLAARIHAAQRAVIEAALAAFFSGSTVVITHHAPHPRSLAAGAWTAVLDAADTSDLSSILQGPHAPALWIHGHVHASCDYRVGNTRVLANPRGYVEAGRPGNAAFDPSLIVPVGDAPRRSSS
ncbi:metallophosphoesterase [Methylorubrum sp. Q1]|uniref:metallophosphoesterase n=1 Tax=Methylorubrum sp. Q1 TaxID=2562453 RepID=UPI001076B414|nr:metallophosphoesterase [Methylorubrum sp. Q1]TFZ56877.1 metallophosphoesterase [Methylorubrum sp. Q1]